MKQRYQRVQRYTGLIFNLAIFIKTLHSKVTARKPSEQANIQITTGLPRLHLACFRTVEASEVTPEGNGRVLRCL